MTYFQTIVLEPIPLFCTLCYTFINSCQCCIGGKKIIKGEKNRNMKVFFFFKLSAPTTDLVSFAIQHVHRYFLHLEMFSVNAGSSSSSSSIEMEKYSEITKWL